MAGLLTFKHVPEGAHSVGFTKKYPDFLISGARRTRHQPPSKRSSIIRDPAEDYLRSRVATPERELWLPRTGLVVATLFVGVPTALHVGYHVEDAQLWWEQLMIDTAEKDMGTHQWITLGVDFADLESRIYSALCVPQEFLGWGDGPSSGRSYTALYHQQSSLKSYAARDAAFTTGLFKHYADMLRPTGATVGRALCPNKSSQPCPFCASVGGGPAKPNQRVRHVASDRHPVSLPKHKGLRAARWQGKEGVRSLALQLRRFPLRHGPPARQGVRPLPTRRARSLLP
jgi:hypothetical protein